MGITEKENELFKKWPKNNKGFVKDGVVDEICYNRSRSKILFVMKEANDPKGGEWDLRKYIRDKGELGRTLGNISKWVHGIRNLTSQLNWLKLENISNDQRKEILKSICVMNLKKSPGGYITDNDLLSKSTLEHKVHLREQFELYEPDIIICCGSITADLFHHIIFDRNPSWDMTSRGIRFFKFQPYKIVISYSHPAARVQDCLLYYGLIDAVKEILKNK